MLNPAYIKNQEKLQQRFRNLVSARADILTKGKKMTPAERAAMLVASGTPSESLMGSFAAGHSSEGEEGEELDDAIDAEDTYGIISKEQMKERQKNLAVNDASF